MPGSVTIAPGILADVSLGTDSLETQAFAASPAFDPNRARENVRERLAYGILAILGATVVGIFALVFTTVPRDLSVITQGLFPALIGITGTVLGFYFGSQSQQPGGGSGGR